MNDQGSNPEIGALAVRYLPISRLHAYPSNARTHSLKQIEQLKSAISEFGWTNPILIDDDFGLIAGHGRLVAASELGLAQVPTICISGLNEVQRRALIIADNKLALNAGWDDALLACELSALSSADFDLALVGFDADELSMLVVNDRDPTAQSPVDESRNLLMVVCSSERELESLFQEIKTRGYECKVLS